MEEKIIIAPFVMKTYQMVNDPCTDHLIGGGPANNSILVMDPMEFSHRILPSFFKHHNFSSFVRQLNTYGFRKMDPDKWEFANKWFLRGQKHLLSNISRRRYTPPPSPPPPHHHLLDRGEDHHDLMAEIGRLRKEQTSLDNEIQIMNQRLDSTERCPKQMIIFLRKIIEDPEIMTRVIMEKGPTLRRLQFLGAISSFNNNFDTPISKIDTYHGPSGLGNEQHICANQRTASLPMGSVLDYSPIKMESTTSRVHREHKADYMCPVMENTPQFPFSLLGG